TAALNGPDDCIEEMRATYRRRRDALVDSFGRAGWPIPAPRASMFAWAPIPEPFQSLGSVEFSTLLVEKASVAVSPGAGFGEYGEGHVRIALVENEQRIRQAARNIRRFLETGPELLHNVVPRPTRRYARAFSPGLAASMAAPLKTGLAGLGTVGTAVVDLLERGRDKLIARCGRPIEVVAVSARSRGKKRAVDLKKIRWIADPVALAADPAIDVFV